MASSALLSNPNLSSSFFGQRLSNQRIRNNYATPRGVIISRPKCAVDSQYGGNVQKFPRSSVWDPYNRLGISCSASEEEIWSSRNFLRQQYAGHESSEESIEAAFERILMDSFWKRKKSKINLKSRLKKQVEESPSWVKNLLNFVELPPKEIIFRRLFLFAFMGGWSIINSAEGGPAFQVAVSLAACIYFLNEKTKNVARASIIGFGALVAGWVCGSFLVPIIPSVLLRHTWTLELLTSLVVLASGVGDVLIHSISGITSFMFLFAIRTLVAANAIRVAKMIKRACNILGTLILTFLLSAHYTL